MRSRPLRGLALLLLSALLLLAGGSCSGYPSAGTLNSTVDAGGATAVAASFRLNHGRLKISGGASSLMRGAFLTDDKYDPSVTYSVHNQQGSLAVTQTGTRSGFSMIPTDSSWTVNLNDEIPLDLAVENGGAHLDLNLDTLTITRLALDVGGGSASISLNGVQREFSAVQLNATSGDVDLHMRGSYDQPRVIDATTISGSLTLDLGGASAAGLTGSIRSTSGGITISIPRETGVKIEASTTSGTINANGLIEKSNGTYVNSAYGTSKTTVSLEVRSTSGPITFKFAS
ncbi:MAG TPA: toast rack family protein [Nitrolancea sp.]